MFQVTATDADAGSHGNFEYTLDQTSLSGTYFFIGSTGIIGVDASLTAFASGSYNLHFLEPSLRLCRSDKMDI